MKTNPLKEGAVIKNSAGIGTVTRKMVRERAVELAAINGRSAHEVSKSDWEQAKRELTGNSDMDSKEAILESAPESERWDPVYGSTGHKVPVRTRMKMVEVTTKDWLMKALEKRSMIKDVKPPGKTWRDSCK
jgi:hypothetical protein